MSVSQENVAKQLVNVAKIIFFSIFFQARFFIDFNEIAKRQREICDAFFTRITYTSSHTVIKQKKITLILKKKKLSINKSRKNIAITKIITQSNQSTKRIKCVCVFQTRCHCHDHEKHHERNLHQRSSRDERLHHRSRHQTFHQRRVRSFQVHHRRRFLRSHWQR